MRKFIYIALAALIYIGCEADDPVNPFDNPDLQAPNDSVNIDTLNPSSFAWLHYKVFKPTCSNSGCHDGTFEPDFRTIESSYNTMVYQPVIKNDPANSYEFRVMPGDANQSVLINRLTVDIDGQSGIMPLSVDPNSDWYDNQANYINAIRNWIDNGAKDQFGNSPSAGNRIPQMTGVVAFADGDPTRLPRDAANGSIRVPVGTQSLEIWFGYEDDETPVSSLSGNTIIFSNEVNDFSSSVTENLTIATNPITEVGYFGDPVTYSHKITINPADYGGLHSFIYFRTSVQDADNPMVSIPDDGSFLYIKKYFSLRMVQ